MLEKLWKDIVKKFKIDPSKVRLMESNLSEFLLRDLLNKNELQMDHIKSVSIYSYTPEKGFTEVFGDETYGGGYDHSVKRGIQMESSR